MLGIDEIFEMLSWDSDEETQLKGIEEAKKVKNLSVFLQPCNEKYSKNIWDNCAKVLASHSDEELSFYFTDLLKWLQDMNWPGAFIIYNRLKAMPATNDIKAEFDFCLKIAKQSGDEVWEKVLQTLKTTLQ